MPQIFYHARQAFTPFFVTAAAAAQAFCADLQQISQRRSVAMDAARSHMGQSLTFIWNRRISKQVYPYEARAEFGTIMSLL